MNRVTKWHYHMEVGRRMAALSRFIRDHSPYTSPENAPNPRWYQEASAHHYRIARRLYGR